MEDWSFYLAYNLFRLASITQGIAPRVLEGTASSAQARATAAATPELAQLAWSYARACSQGHRQAPAKYRGNLEEGTRTPRPANEGQTSNQRRGRGSRGLRIADHPTSLAQGDLEKAHPDVQPLLVGLVHRHAQHDAPAPDHQHHGLVQRQRR